ncbi:MAG: hypothetical protein ACXV98_15810 [Ilumatobacteraceae bacterium]
MDSAYGDRPWMSWVLIAAGFVVAFMVLLNGPRSVERTLHPVTTHSITVDENGMITGLDTTQASAVSKRRLGTYIASAVVAGAPTVWLITRRVRRSRQT